MDVLTSTQLAKLIKQITETGEWNLDQDDLKSIKNICKRSDANVDFTFEHWFAQIKKEHAQIRYSCVQLAEQLFQRSHRFRTLLADEFPQFIALTVGVRQKKLPPPASVATKLKQYSLALIKAWHDKFANKYRPIAIAYDYLQHNGVLAADQPSLNSIHSQNEDRANRLARMQPVYERRLEQIASESEEQLPIIYENLQQMEGCFEILIPKYDDASGIDFDALMKGDIESSKVEAQDHNTYKEEIRSHGLASNRYKLEIVMSENPVADEVHESNENQVIFEQLRESYKVARDKHAKELNGWINSLGRMDLQNSEGRRTLLKKLLDVKAEMTETIRKAELLGIRLPADDNAEESEDEDEYLDELFEEVELPSSSSRAKKNEKNPRLPPAQRIFPLAFEPGMEEDVTYNRAHVFPEVKSSTISGQEREAALEDNDNIDRSSKGKGKATTKPNQEELLKQAPVVEWGDDLFYWDKNEVQFNTSGIERSHRFMGVGEGSNEMPEHLLEQLRKRTIYYKPQVPQNLKACRAPLRSGNLCPRRDLVTCPFHGKIIPRDEIGRPVKPQDRPSTSSSAATTNTGTTAATIQQQPASHSDSTDDLWQDIERDVMRQVDQPLIEPSKGKRKRKKPQSNLADVRKKKETSFTRLQKRVDAPQTRRMVEEAQDYERSIKARDKKMNLW